MQGKNWSQIKNLQKKHIVSTHGDLWDDKQWF